MYEEKFAVLKNELGDDTGKWETFLQNPESALGEAGIPIVKEVGLTQSSAQALKSIPVSDLEAGVKEAQESQSAPSFQAMSLEQAEEIRADVHWWGVNIVMNEKLTQNIIHGVVGVGAVGSLLASIITIVSPPAAAIIGAGLAAVFALKVAEIKMVNNGKGVHWPISWPQWASLVAAVPLGPAGLVAAAIVFIHPVRN